MHAERRLDAGGQARREEAKGLAQQLDRRTALGLVHGALGDVLLLDAVPRMQQTCARLGGVLKRKVERSSLSLSLSLSSVGACFRPLSSQERRNARLSASGVERESLRSLAFPRATRAKSETRAHHKSEIREYSLSLSFAKIRQTNRERAVRQFAARREEEQPAGVGVQTTDGVPARATPFFERERERESARARARAALRRAGERTALCANLAAVRR